MRYICERSAKVLYILVFLLMLVIILVPYIKNGFWADDALNSQTWGMLKRFHSNVWLFSYRVSKTWFNDYGRILIAWPAIYSFFYVVRSEIAVRLAEITMFLGHVGITILLLKRLKIDWRTIGIFVLVLLAVMQIRGPDDPLAAYAGFSQGVGILLGISLLLLHQWYERAATGWLIASSLLAALTMGCYEVAVVYVPIAIVAIVVASRRRRLWRDLLIVFIPFVVIIIGNLCAKHVASRPYDGSEVGHLNAVSITFLKQLSATFPGSFYALAGWHQLPLSGLIKVALTSPLAWIVAILWSGSLLMLFKNRSNDSANLRFVMFAASMLLIVPPALISLSAKYQSGLTWGAAHVPVYFQCFGLAFLTAGALVRVPEELVAKFVTPAALLFGIYVALNWAMNMQQSAMWDAAYREPRDSLTSALHEGLLNGVRDGDVVQIDGQPIFINGNLIYQEIEKNVSIPHEAAIAGWFESEPRQDAVHYRLFRDAASGNKWVLTRQ